ncbi:cytochrome P450 [Hypoxylon sp. NC0597]|nr:cytochrome P450 [Hypoxylon sp. NC0597]
MEDIIKNISWRPVIVAIILLLPSIAIHRLFYHPLARFPGPKLAAITRYVEAYYDVICGGKYEFQIMKMHEKYGPIVRISPHELHIHDANFFEKLYNRDGYWNKYDWTYDAHNSQLSTLASIDHNVHKRRRAAMNPFFSKASVVSRQSIIRGTTSKLCYRLNGFIDSKDSQVRLGAALGALTRDVATEFLLGKSPNNLDAEDFRAGVGDTLQESGAIWRIAKHIRWYGRMVRSIPLSVIKKIGDQGVITCLEFLEDMKRTTASIRSAHTSGNIDLNSPPTIVSAIIDSDLPEAEKTHERLADEIITVVGAAFETTAYSLCVILYHTYSEPGILQRLRAELADAKLNREDPNLVDLENLPYLTAVLREGLRLSPAIATRMARIAPDRDLTYEKFRIPAGTPVGMTLLSMHTDPLLYPDPQRFDPERWTDTDTRNKTNKAYAPFSRGTRNCIGMQ